MKNAATVVRTYMEYLAEKSIVVFIIASFLVIGCSDKEIPLQGNTFPLKTTQLQYERKTFTAVEDTVFTEEVKSGMSQLLVLGRNNYYESRILLKFENLPDSTVINSATLVMYVHNVRGDGQPFKCTIHEVTSEWQEDMNSFRFSGAEPLIEYSLRESGSYMVSDDESVADSVYINSMLVEQWTHSLEFNNGIFLSFDNAEFQKEYYSDEGSSSPELKLNFIRNGKDTTAVYKATKTLFVVEGGIAHENGYTIIGTGAGQRIGLKFNLESIPVYATIIEANLILKIQEEKSDYSSFREDSLTIVMFDSTWSIEPRLYQTAASEQNVIKNGEFEADIVTFAQYWITGSRKNNGIAVQSSHEGYNLSYFVTGSVESNDEDSKPKLEIYYGIPPSKLFKTK